MRLAPAVEHRGRAVAAHPRRAHLVDAVAGRSQVGAGLLPGGDVGAAGRFQHGGGVAGGLAHHRLLVGPVRGLDARQRDPPAVDPRGRQRHPVLRIGQHLAERPQRQHPGAPLAVPAADLARPTLHAEAAQVGLVGLCDPRIAWDVDAGRPVGLPGLVLETGRIGPDDLAAADMVHQVAPDLVAAVGQPARERLGARVQQQRRRIDRRGVEEHHPGVIGRGDLAQPVDRPHARDPPGRGVIDHALDDGVGDHGQVAGRPRRRQRRGLGRERRPQRTAVVAAHIALAALAPQVHLRLGHPAQVRAATHQEAPRRERRFDAALGVLLDAVERERRQEITVRQLRDLVVIAADPDERLDVIVPGLKVFVADGPVDAVPVPQVGFEIVRRPAIGLPRPGQRAPAQVIAADPAVRLSLGLLVRIVVVAGPELLVRVEHRIADADIVRVVQRLLVVGNLVVAPAQPPRLLVAVVRPVLDMRPTLQHQHLEAALAQLLGDPAAADA